MSDPIRELEIAEAQLTRLRIELATMAELNESQREILQKVAVERDALRQRAEAAEAALALATNSTPGKGTGVWMTLDAYQDLLSQLTEIEERVKAQMVQLAAVTAQRDALAQRNDLAAVHVAAITFDNLRPDIDRYGADQWRNGNAGREPQEFSEWRQEAQP